MRNRAIITLNLFGSLLLVYALLRVVFLMVYFAGEEWNFRSSASLFYRGFRMDFAALYYSNLPFLVYFFLIEPFLRFTYKARVSLILFCLVNLPLLALNFTDLVYYGYNHRRSTVDLLLVLPDSSNAYAGFLRQYWYVLLIFLLVAFALVKRWQKPLSQAGRRESKLGAYLVTVFLLLGAGFMIARGFSRRPILPSTPLLYFDARLQPLVNNSTFNFLYSIVRKQSNLEPKRYFSESKLDSLFQIEQRYPQQLAFDKRNVVVFVLESFSKDLFPGGSEAARMPFFDSLMRQSMVFNNAFANALESNKGLPAILASLPDVMDEPVYLSNYANIPFRGIGHMLREKGYHTSFYLGAEHDHFGFARLSKMVGIEHYRSKESFRPRDNEEDGNWGVYDEYFFPFFAKEMAKTPQPFFSVLYNISSHPPYKLPASADRLRVKGQRPWQDAATYVDHCFSELFRGIRKQPWFGNTVFVFIADHGYRYKSSPDNQLTELRIPFFIYDPQQPVHRPVHRVVKQLDLVPTVLDRLRYTDSFISFGRSAYRPGAAFSLNRLAGLQQYIDSVDFLGYDDEEDRLVFHYRYREDSLLQRNLVKAGEQPPAGQLDYLKAVIQRMNNSLWANSFTGDHAPATGRGGN